MALNQILLSPEFILTYRDMMLRGLQNEMQATRKSSPRYLIPDAITGPIRTSSALWRECNGPSADEEWKPLNPLDPVLKAARDRAALVFDVHQRPTKHPLPKSSSSECPLGP